MAIDLKNPFFQTDKETVILFNTSSGLLEENLIE